MYDDNFRELILDVSSKIYNFAEIGSQEYKSSKLLMEILQSKGFVITNPYMGMDTAFRAEYGIGHPAVGILAEFDALPNGHSCGHNLISAWALGTAIKVAESLKSGRIVVFGTPSEEGIGPYAGSKAIMAEKGAFKDIDFVMGMHPDDRWAVGSKALADAEMEFTFLGKSAHMAASPCYGINALDALVTSYTAINNMRDWIKNDKHSVIGMIIKEGGRASNVVPDRAVLEVDVRSSSSDFLKKLVLKIKKLVKSVSEGFGTQLIIKDLMPMYTEYKPNKTIDSILLKNLNKFNINAYNIDNEEGYGCGSTDEANVSLSVPTGHIDMKIGTNIPGHSDEFRNAANPKRAANNLFTTINVAYNSIMEILENQETLVKIKNEFGGDHGEN
ncbi:amidohydrolase [Acidiplasma cupricumulans]|nr:amidohydrolase [Acidiplasma cupricumulans]